MAHLKLQEYGKAEADCCGALDLKPDHVKSLTRRATARRRLGRFKLALVDLRKAQGLDPSSGEILSDIKLVESKLREQKQKAKEKLVKKYYYSSRYIFIYKYIYTVLNYMLS